MSKITIKKAAVKKSAAKKAVAKNAAPKKAVVKKAAPKKAVAKAKYVNTYVEASTTSRSPMRRAEAPVAFFSPQGTPRAPETHDKKSHDKNRTRLLELAQLIVNNSTAEEAVDFNTSKWLDDWIKTPQPALNGRKPSEMLDTDDGLLAVEKVLGAIESGSYQ